MSELKVIDLGNIRESIEKDEPVYYEYYAKSEADKVIAEKDAEICRLKNGIAPKYSDKTLQERLNEVCEKHGVSTLQDLDWAFCESEKRRTKDNIDAVSIIYHHKYKRCMAMAKWCEGGKLIYQYKQRCEDAKTEMWLDYLMKRTEWYHKWEKRWLALAEKFKPNSTAQ